MCPACVATVIAVVGGAAWTGGLAALVARDVREESRGR